MSKEINKTGIITEVVGSRNKWLSESEVKEKYKDIELTQVGMDALRLTLGYLMGDIDIEKPKLGTLKMLVSQFLPNAGTNVNVNVNIRPEEYIAKAMEDNVGAYEALLAKAIDVDNSLRGRSDIRVIEAEYKELLNEDKGDME